MNPTTCHRTFKVLSIFAIGVLSAGLSFGAPCVAGTAGAYQVLGAGGCTINVAGTTLLFSNFKFTQNAAGPTVGGGAEQIQLAPIVFANSAGFRLTPIGAFSASATGVNDIELIFIASVVGGANLINGLNASMTGSAGVSNVGGGLPGQNTLLENLCRGGSLPPGSCPIGQGGTLVQFLDITGPAAGTVTQSTVFEATNALSILKDIQVSGHNGDIPSSVTDVTNLIVLAVPEPSMAIVLAMALCGLFAFRRRLAR